MAAFELSKWYLDCVDDEGDAAIVYTGSAHWGNVRLAYSGVLESQAGQVSMRHSIGRQAEPRFEDGVLRWGNDALGFRGEWRGDAAAQLQETVYASEAGRIEWHCLLPSAKAEAGTRRGRGYAEHLRMTVAPWALPIRTLRWGRFLSESEWMVWIDWEGGFSQRIVYRNGQRVSVATVEDARLVFEDGAMLVMDQSLVLRNGALGSKALSAIPGARLLLPRRLLGVMECKWRSGARLDQGEKPSVAGWAIHERVDWPE